MNPILRIFTLDPLNKESLDQNRPGESCLSSGQKMMMMMILLLFTCTELHVAVMFSSFITDTRGNSFSKFISMVTIRRMLLKVTFFTRFAIRESTGEIYIKPYFQEVWRFS